MFVLQECQKDRHWFGLHKSWKGRHSFGLHENQSRRQQELSLSVDSPSVRIGSRQILILIIKVHNSNSKGEKLIFYSSNQTDTI